MTTDVAAGAVIEVLRGALTPVAGKISAAFIYGPLARGAAKPNCDVDIFIVGEALKHIDVLPHLVRAENTMNRRIHISIYAPDEVIDKLHHRNAFHVAVMNQPKIMLIGAERDLPAINRH